MSDGGMRRATLVLAVVTVLVLAVSLPGSIRDAYVRGGVYVFSHQFFEDLPKRLIGPGRFRFLLQPTFAIALGVKAGRSDASSGRSPYLSALLLGREPRGALVRNTFESIAHLLLAGVLVDSVCQWLILGSSYPGAALVVGPVLIAAPYAVARALANRIVAARARKHAQ
jgi:hypothetical protein